MLKLAESKAMYGTVLTTASRGGSGPGGPLPPDHTPSTMVEARWVLFWRGEAPPDEKCINPLYVYSTAVTESLPACILSSRLFHVCMDVSGGGRGEGWG